MNMGEKMTKTTLKTTAKIILLSTAIVICTKAGSSMAQVCCEDNIGLTTVTERPVVVQRPVTPVIVQRPVVEFAPVAPSSLTYTAAYPAAETVLNTYKIENETVYRVEQQTRTRQVWDDEIRERRYTVYRQVPETTIKQEIYKVLKPTWTTEYRDTSYDVIRNVPETSVREERYTVSRPVWETAERDVWQTVRRPVQETYMQERQYVVNRPVTNYQTELVDRGQYVNYTAVEPGRSYNRLAWQRGGTYVDPITGAARRQLPGLYWTPMQGDAKLRQETVYQPNLVQQVTPVTTLVPETVVEQVPTTRLTYQEERVLKKEPYQVMRMVQEERVRQIPETKVRQVVERVQQTTPVQVYRLESQEVARDIPVTSYKTVGEERVEQYTVKVPRIEQIVETVQKPYTVQKRIPLDQFGNPTTLDRGVPTMAPLTTQPASTPDMGYVPPAGADGTAAGAGSSSNRTYAGEQVNASGGTGAQNGGSKDPADTPPAIPQRDGKPAGNQMDLGSDNPRT